jgi:hypothetical protein
MRFRHAACMRKIKYMNLFLNFLEKEYSKELIHKPKEWFEILKTINQRVVKWNVSAQIKCLLLEVIWSSSTVSNTIITTDSVFKGTT